MADSTMELGVREKVVIITGAARGIGQEFARSLGAAGAFVVAADINDCSPTFELVKAENGRRSASGLTSGAPNPHRTW